MNTCKRMGGLRDCMKSIWLLILRSNVMVPFMKTQKIRMIKVGYITY